MTIPREDSITLDPFPCIEVNQPIGKFYIASIPSDILVRISYADIRRIEKERDIETYLGIQRPLSKDRIKDLQIYVGTTDACFPTSVILAISGKCAEYDEDNRMMALRNNMPETDDDGEQINLIQIAQVIDGQHRIEGLRNYKGSPFEVNVSIFVDIDIPQQAYIFSTVNLAQTKVNKSLVYDLFDLEKSRSPQKLCHNIAVALDSEINSPFYKRIKRLGSATKGRYGETLTQATFIKGIIGYFSRNETVDRDTYMKNQTPEKANADELTKMPFRNMMIDKKDLEVTDILWNYFDAVKNRWPTAWESLGRGNILNKTNGYNGLVRFLRPAYLHLTSPGNVPSTKDFQVLFDKIQLSDSDFTVDTFKPGTSGSSELYRVLLRESGIDPS